MNVFGFFFCLSNGFLGRKEREKSNVAESSKQCILMVVGQPHQDKAVKMAGTKPSRYVCIYMCTCMYIWYAYMYVLSIQIGLGVSGDM